MKVKDVGRWVMFGLSAPWFILGWLFVLLFWGWATEFKLQVRETMVLSSRFRPWVEGKGFRVLQWIRWPFGRMFLKDVNADGTARVTLDPAKSHTRSFWAYSTTLGRGVILQPYADQPTVEHEMVHVRQCEDVCVRGLIAGVLVAVCAAVGGASPEACALLWAGCWIGLHIMTPLNYLGAFLRGGDYYRDSEHERSAYAQTDSRGYYSVGESWLDNRRRSLGE